MKRVLEQLGEKVRKILRMQYYVKERTKENNSPFDADSADSTNSNAYV